MSFQAQATNPTEDALEMFETYEYKNTFIKLNKN
jgi:hypothetical protein